MKPTQQFFCSVLHTFSLNIYIARNKTVLTSYPSLPKTSNRNSPILNVLKLGLENCQTANVRKKKEQPEISKGKSKGSCNNWRFYC